MFVVVVFVGWFDFVRCLPMFGLCLFWFVGLVQNNIKTTANKTDNSKNNKNLTIISFSTFFFVLLILLGFVLCFAYVLIRFCWKQQQTNKQQQLFRGDQGREFRLYRYIYRVQCICRVSDSICSYQKKTCLSC